MTVAVHWTCEPVVRSKCVDKLLIVFALALFLIPFGARSTAQQNGPPPSPIVELVPGDHEVMVLWGHLDSLRSEQWVDSFPPHFADFEGYRLYRSYFANGHRLVGWVMLAQWDRENRWVVNPSDTTIRYWISVGHNVWPPPENTHTGEYPEFKYGFTDSGLTNYYPLQYCVTAFDFGNPATGDTSQESSESTNAEKVFPNPRPGDFAAEKDVGVVPNPYSLSEESPTWFADGGGGQISFTHLPPQCTIRIYTLGGDLLTTIEHTDDQVSVESWDPKSTASERIVPGIYLFSVEEHPSGLIQVGKFVIIE